MRRRNPSMMASRKMKLLFDESELPGLYCRSSQTLELTVGGRFTFAQHRETGQVLERLPAPLDGQGLHFDRMKLRGADLRRAAPGSEATLNLVEAHLSYKDLSGATLEGQNLTRAHLHDADLKDGDFTGARLVCASVDGGGSVLYRVEDHTRLWNRDYAYSYRCRVDEQSFHVMGVPLVTCAGSTRRSGWSPCIPCLAWSCPCWGKEPMQRVRRSA